MVQLVSNAADTSIIIFNLKLGDSYETELQKMKRSRLNTFGIDNYMEKILNTN